ncbi:adenylyl-sulfate kinase [Pseudomonas sp. TH03]|uniref:adenylyl-sulfate kinase n=1 Tax=Pseudomonas sp. TH03 TaxID=2796369 RepID=UPI001F5B7277|nr:adenylyl-sulfate kinase [Pseudomonas sp. TH03]
MHYSPAASPPLSANPYLMPHCFEVDRDAQCSLKRHRSFLLWFTGMSGAGKSCIANKVQKNLHLNNAHTCLLDGDTLRTGLNGDLGFADAYRKENVRRTAEVGKLMVDSGLITLVCLISPFENERRMARALFAREDFIEIFVDAPLHVLERRDPKGLYARARKGLIRNFTGIDSPYERPVAPDIVIDSTKLSSRDNIDSGMPFAATAALSAVAGAVATALAAFAAVANNAKMANPNTTALNGWRFFTGFSLENESVVAHSSMLKTDICMTKDGAFSTV